MKNFVLPFALAGLFLTCAGCGQEDKGPRTVKAEGTVTLDGNPVEGAAVVFVDAAGKYPAQGRTDAEGHFSLNAFEYKTGAVPGEYKVIVRRTVVSEVAPPKPDSEEAEHAGEEGAGGAVRNDMPAKYGQPNENFKFTIPEEGTDSLKLELTSK